MNKMEQIKVKKQAKAMQQASDQSAELLVQLKKIIGDHIPDTVEEHLLYKELDNVIQHQKNMSKFFGMMQR